MIREMQPLGRGVADRRCDARGFTLIELMITVAIVAILASLAYPAYTSSILKGRRAEGRTALLNLLQQQERYLTQTGCYLPFTQAQGVAGSTTNCASASVTIPFRTRSGDGSGGAYQLVSTACTGLAVTECISLTAIPAGSDPDAGTLSLTSAGVKDCTGSKRTVKGVCW